MLIPFVPEWARTSVAYNSAGRRPAPAVTNWWEMPPLATDWATISAMITGAGTLVLALATFASVRSSNRSARIAEAALQEQRRPVLVPSRFNADQQPGPQKADRPWMARVLQEPHQRDHLGVSLRNAGSG
jgi:hypothetical protein